MSLDKTSAKSNRRCGECRTPLEVWDIDNDYEVVQLFCPKCEAGCGLIDRSEL